MEDIEIPVKKFGMKDVKPFSKTWNKVNDFNWWSKPTVSQNLKIENLIAVQDIVTVKGLLGAENNNAFIKVVRIDRKLYIRDGHHRVAVAKLLGEKEISAYVVTL